MRITKEQLKQIIKEEIQAVMNEDDSQQALVSKIVELDPDVEDALDEYILSPDGDWESDYVNQIGSMGLEAVARDWLNDYEQGNLGDALAAFDAQDKEDAFYLREAYSSAEPQIAYDFTDEQKEAMRKVIEKLNNRKTLRYHTMASALRFLKYRHPAFKGFEGEPLDIQNGLKSLGYKGYTVSTTAIP